MVSNDDWLEKNPISQDILTFNHHHNPIGGHVLGWSVPGLVSRPNPTRSGPGPILQHWIIAVVDRNLTSP